MSESLNIRAIEVKLKITFTQPQLLITAFTHPSYKNESLASIEDSERLEFLGDAVLGLIVTEYLFSLFPALDEGTLSTVRAALVNAKACYSYTQALGVGQYLLIGRGERVQNQRGQFSAYANLFEAILGAIYLDHGLALARQITIPLLPSKEAIFPLMLGNPKNRLQQLTQKHLRTLPLYQATLLTTPGGTGGYHVQVVVNKEIWGEGCATSKKEAEQLAAQQALETHDYENQNTMDM
ncbi:ribonuclease III [Candidatus Chlamydia sanziniae]|uniref:Ribonuclease 3 n=1 Tax=Candidatus Chlamydia sanziniae TaxID=1806891 RepID=A0A1A9HTM1_9CHLA|nr:ribonuclease III [Candidatus Chlamydia sanziniae]ANH78185.1 Ribonuclease III [Candidatus Chlamydia sanziniae]